MKISHTPLADEQLFEIKQEGAYVSGRCHIFDDDDSGQRMILAHGRVAYIFDRNDNLSERQVWVQVYNAGLANQKEIANANDFSQRTFVYWLKRYREEGAIGLQVKARSGAPRKVTDEIVLEIYALRDAGVKLRIIAENFSISVSSVEHALEARKLANAPVQPELIQEESDASNEGDESSNEQDADEPGFQVSSEAPKAVKTPVPMTIDDDVEDVLARNRSADRVLASQGKIQDAQPLFHENEHVTYAGLFLAIACLGEDSYLRCAVERFGQFKAAFYGTRTIFLNFLLMLLLRIDRVDHLQGINPTDLGFILGLDRSPEVKTIRRRLTQLSEKDCAAELMSDLAKARCEDPFSVIYIDDHVQVYHGKKKVGRVFSNRTKQVHKARSEQWSHASDGTPLIAIESEFNETLIDLLPKSIDILCKSLEVDSVNLVFDRAGYCGEFLEKLKTSNQCTFSLYRRGPYASIPDDKLVFEETTIGSKTFRCKPYDYTVKIPVYENVKDDKGETRRKQTRTVELREIRVVTPDSRQLAILSDPSDKRCPKEIVLDMQGRWGAQENVFKYQRKHHGLDALWGYQSDLVTDPKLDHPHADRKAPERELKKKQKSRAAIYKRYGEILLNGKHCGDDKKIKKAIEGQRKKDKAKKQKNKDLETLDELDEKIAELRQNLAKIPERETAVSGGYQVLSSKLRLLQNAIITSAYHIEGRLVKMLGDDYARCGQEGRSLIAAAFQTKGSLRLAPGKILIELAPQSSPHRTRAINALSERLTALRASYPGSSRVIEFIPTPVSQPASRSSKKSPKRAI